MESSIIEFLKLLAKVSELARKMVTMYGMSPKMGNMAYGKSPANK
jgi:ATP-dependent Zn protease